MSDALAVPDPASGPPGDTPTHDLDDCRRVRPERYRCACGRVRDRCVRAAVRALWSPVHRVPGAGVRLRTTRPARP
ncbi:hypothetical protein GA0070620_2996 [Micromonospora krabiensis]|uniref:Uncharacterized protein n=1 Tax=Micromonospora krabiensis TaxID=307121 RepID=A0A1C3N4H3_9ACTN|nr:hypothetical protein GA0070620_2996 [Micromonospora krabiensis]